MAVPFHGAHRARHVLNAATRAMLFGAAVASLGACAADVTEGDGAGSGAGNGGAAAARPAPGARAAAVDAGLTDRLAAAWARSAGADAPAVAEPRWPEDFGSHADVPLETREWLSVLRDGSGTVYGLRQRITRIALPGRAGGEGAAGPDASGSPGSPDSPGSPWRYDSVVRVDGTLERDGGVRTAWSSVERDAVGLAGSPAPPATGLHVLGDVVGSVDAPGDGHGIDGGGGACALEWRTVATGVARLTGRADECPVGRAAGGVAVASLGGFGTSGSLLADGDGASDMPVTGVAWQRLAWGAVPPLGGGGAVLFDRATLTLAGLGSVELLRSKRASGRGTPRTTATALDARARVAGLLDGLDVEWSAPAAGAAPTDAGRLRVPALDVDVGLRALSPVVPEDDGLERVFRGAVIAAGTHAGAGFIEHRPLPSAGAADETDGDASGDGTRT